MTKSQVQIKIIKNNDISQGINDLACWLVELPRRAIPSLSESEKSSPLSKSCLTLWAEAGKKMQKSSMFNYGDTCIKSNSIIISYIVTRKALKLGIRWFSRREPPSDWLSSITFRNPIKYFHKCVKKNTKITMFIFEERGDQDKPFFLTFLYFPNSL